MPKATVSTEPMSFNLESAPPDGYVVVKPLSYGQKKNRADISGRMYSEMTKRGIADKTFIEALNRAATLFDFQHCIVDHNLENDGGDKLNFNLDGTIDILDPRVGDEIEKILMKINGDEDDLRDFTRELGISPQNESQVEPVQSH